MTAVSAGPAATCPRCGAERIPGATFCEACAFDFTDVAPPGQPAPRSGEGGGAPGVAPPVTARPGEESPLDVGWTGPLLSRTTTADGVTVGPGPAAPERVLCKRCGQGHYLDGYCDTCGSKQPDPRDHFSEAPASWVAGVCDIGRRHRRNEDAMALAADAPALSFASLVVCDGVSNSTDSHVASLAASRAAREVLAEPLPLGVGTRQTVVAAAARRLDEAAKAAQQAVVRTTEAAGDAAVESPPSCTFVAALVRGRTAVVGNVGDSRAYWLPDATDSPAAQLTEDDSFAAAQVSAGVPRKEAESSAGAHAITRWLGVDAPDDTTPHIRDLELAQDGWLLVCSDGLWNYCSEAADLQRLVHETAARLGAAGLQPPALAQALTDFANERGGVDNITVALARVGAVSAVSAAHSLDDTHTADDTHTDDSHTKDKDIP